LKTLIGVTTVWSIETRGAEKENPGGILYNPAHYSNALYQAGGLPVLIAPPVLENDSATLEALAGSILDKLAGLYFSGGGGTRLFKAPDMPGLEKQQPVRYRFETMLIKEACKRNMPMIGACRGHQMIVEALGGKIKRDTVTGHQQKDEDKILHPVQIEKTSRLEKLIGKESWPVNSLHCQVAEKAPPGFIVSARSPEGYIEAIEAEGPVFQMGFQFHPEIMCEFDPLAKGLIGSFVAAAEDYSRSR